MKGSASSTVRGDVRRCRASLLPSLLRYGLETRWDQVDSHVKPVQARGVEVMPEQGEAGGGVRPGGLDEYLVAGGGDARHGPARIIGPPLGHRLHFALPGRP